jgi:hypothetical protein
MILKVVAVIWNTNAALSRSNIGSSPLMASVCWFGLWDWLLLNPRAAFVRSDNKLGKLPYEQSISTSNL